MAPMKHLTHRLVMTSFAASMLFVGAGCPGMTGHDIAVPATGANGESDLSSTNGVSAGLQEQAYLKQERDAYGSAEQPPAGQQQQMPPQDTSAQVNASADASVPIPPKPTMSELPKVFPGVLPAARIHNKVVTIATAKGNITFEVLDGEAPKASSNFIALAEAGFYDGLTFHRVEPGFVIQGGDPSGNGTGGPGYQFEDEPVRLDYKEGIVAMANAGADTNGSQFFIMLADTPLPKKYTIFGRVLTGMDVVHKIVKGDRMTSVMVGGK